MRRSFIVSSVALCLLLLVAPAMAQDKLEGRWEGKISSPQGERPATATFKKEGAAYTGAITGMRGDIALKEIKVEGDKVTAKAEVEAQGSTIVINYSFTLQGETLKGAGSLDFNGNAFSFDIDLKRAGAATAQAAPAQQDKPAAGDRLAGRWEGKLNSPRGDAPMWAVFSKEGAAYTGKVSGMMPGQEITLKDVKLDGDKVTAKADVETPQATITINYNFTLQGETLKGVGALDFNGNAISLGIELKRGGGAAANSQDGAAANARPQRSTVDQPQQKQSIDYFVGQWSYKYIGRESALGPAPREGVVTFSKRADGKSVEGAATGKHEGGAYKESFVISFDEASKALSFSEKLSSGVALTSRGDWSSPISIRFTIDPVTVKGQKLQLRRTISVVAAHSFAVTEELSEDGGPFVRLGNAIYSKVNAN